MSGCSSSTGCGLEAAGWVLPCEDDVLPLEPELELEPELAFDDPDVEPVFPDVEPVLAVGGKRIDSSIAVEPLYKTGCSYRCSSF